jgi:beta-1,4-N-acetylglucosaminyltransferase
MIKGLVTVGTTTFDSLISSLDQPSIDVELTFQIAGGGYIPVNHPYKRFIKDIKLIYSDFDFIITHAGAGSVYNLLEAGLKMAVVANLDRSDQHQLELSHFIKESNFSAVYSVEQIRVLSLETLAVEIQSYETVPYKKESFFKGKEILDFIFR